MVIAQDLYVKLFAWISDRLTEITCGRVVDIKQMQVISLLEAGGVEFASEKAYFESFTINYAAERVE